MSRKPFYEQGPYWGKITHQRLTEAKTGTPQLVLTFLILGRVNPADPDGDLIAVPAQYERSVYRPLTDKTVSYVVEDMDTLGWTGENWSQWDEESPGCVDIRGLETGFFCTHEQDQGGDIRERWKLSKGGGTSTVKPMEQSAVKKLDAMFGKALKGRAKPTTRPTNGTAAKAPDPPAEKPQRQKAEKPAYPDVNNHDANAAFEEAAVGDDIPF